MIIIPTTTAISMTQQTQHFDTTAVLQSDSALVVSPAAKTMQILAKHTDTLIYRQFTIDAVAISPHTPADFGHVVASIQVDSAPKKVAHSSLVMGISQVDAVSPPGTVVNFFSSITPAMTRIYMVAADMSPTLSRSAVAKLPQVVVGMKADILQTRTIADPGFAIAT